VSGEELLPGATPLADLGLVVLARGEVDLAAPVVEISPNKGPRIDMMLAAAGLFAPAEWNAPAVTAWILEAAEEARRTAPIRGGAAGAKGHYVVEQLKRARRWLSKAQLTSSSIRPGMIAASKLSAASPVVLVGVVREVSPAGEILCIDGDAGPNTDRVALRVRQLSDPLFLGCGFL